MNHITSNINWIIVGTYKTHPEANGWYIASDYQRLFWDHIPYNVDKTTAYNEKEGYGYLKSFPNIIFFDYVKHDCTLKSSKDEDIIKSKFQNLIDGVSKLRIICSKLKGQIRIGFVGFNSYGLFYNTINNSIPPNKSPFWKELRKKDNYGKQFVNYEKNTNIYLLENITSRYYKTHFVELNGWKSFWLI